MIKRMLIDDTQPEETRVVVINNNKLEDVEFETTHRRQIKGNIYLGKIMRVEPSLQACFVDYGGNKHGFMAFGEIHPDYYTLSKEEMEALDKEVDEIIENKKQNLKERELEKERIRQEKNAAREEALKQKADDAARKRSDKAEETAPTTSEQTDSPAGNDSKPERGSAHSDGIETKDDTLGELGQNSSKEAPKSAAKQRKSHAHAAQSLKETTEEENLFPAAASDSSTTDAEAENNENGEGDKKHQPKKRLLKKRYRKQRPTDEENANTTETENSSAPVAPVNNGEPLKVMTENSGNEGESVSEELDVKGAPFADSEEEVDADEDEAEMDFELQRKLIKARKLFHRSRIQDVIKEGQILLVQVVKEERGNKGAALTTYLSLAGRYCVLMPNRIKSGGVSRKITNAADRTRLKTIVKELPLTSDMSMIVRTAGEEKTKADIVRDYNYLIRTWNQIRIDSLVKKAPALIHEEGNLIKRALRDIYTKDTTEIIVAGEEAYKLAKDFFRILSPHNLKKIKNYKNNDMPLFQRFQVEGQLDKLHEANAYLESGGYLVINPTEALVSIDVNSGRATKEKDLEETALKTNLEACDEIARQLRLRNLAGLVVIDFIDMEEQANNHAIEKRMKEALKKDRSRIQVGKMSIFGLLELSRQRMHSSFFESNYQVCPHCQGKGMIRTTESSSVFVLRGIEEEGIKNRSSRINVYVPTEIAIYLLNQKRQMLIDLEEKYKMNVIISSDDTVKCVSDYRIERTKSLKCDDDKTEEITAAVQPKDEPIIDKAEENSTANDNSLNKDEVKSEENREGNYRNNRRRRDNRRRGRNRYDRDRSRNENNDEAKPAKEKSEAIILYNSHEDIKSNKTVTTNAENDEPAKEKSTWWKKLIKG